MPVKLLFLIVMTFSVGSPHSIVALLYRVFSRSILCYACIHGDSILSIKDIEHILNQDILVVSDSPVDCDVAYIIRANTNTIEYYGTSMPRVLTNSNCDPVRGCAALANGQRRGICSYLSSDH